jgi:hypothetical protein
MAEILNQFGYSEQKSSVKNGDKGHSFSCKLASAAANGTFVKLSSVSGSKVIVVTACTADTDDVFGIIPYESAKANTYVSGEMVTVVGDYARIVCEASAAISAGATVMPVITGLKVATQTTGKTGIGIALTPASADTDLIEVLIKRPLVVA